MKNVFKHFWNDKPSLFLWLFTFGFILDTIFNGTNNSLFMVVYLIAVTFYVNERGKFMKDANNLITNANVRLRLGLPEIWTPESKRKFTPFEIVVRMIILGSVAVFMVYWFWRILWGE